MDANSGAVLTESNSDQRLPPASLTKLMTAYIATLEINRGRIKESDMVTVSEHAWRTGGSRVFIKVGTQVSVGDLLHGIIIQSGNDASVALAEHIAGSEDAFADMMNTTAQKLGMQNTHFMDATGLPDPNPRPTTWRSWRAPSSTPMPSTTPSTPRRNSSGTTSSSPTATSCCGATRPSTA